MFSCSFYSFGQSPVRCETGSFQQHAAITCKRCNKFYSKLAGWGRSRALTCLPRDEGNVASSSGLSISKGFLTFGITLRHLNLHGVSHFWMCGMERTDRARLLELRLCSGAELRAEFLHGRAASALSCCCSAVGREPCWLSETHWVTANESGVERVRIRLWM